VRILDCTAVMVFNFPMNLCSEVYQYLLPISKIVCPTELWLEHTTEPSARYRADHVVLLNYLRLINRMRSKTMVLKAVLAEISWSLIGR